MPLAPLAAARVGSVDTPVVGAREEPSLLMLLAHANVAVRRQSVLPVPVGDSSKAFFLCANVKRWIAALLERTTHLLQTLNHSFHVDLLHLIRLEWKIHFNSSNFIFRHSIQKTFCRAPGGRVQCQHLNKVFS
jgi:hypothetical protein